MLLTVFVVEAIQAALSLRPEIGERSLGWSADNVGNTGLSQKSKESISLNVHLASYFAMNLCNFLIVVDSLFGFFLLWL